MRLLISFAALFLAVVFVQLGSGTLGPLDALAGGARGFTTSEIGLLGSAHFTGFFIGCWVAPRMMGTIGHSRTFAAFAAIGTIAALVHQCTFLQRMPSDLLQLPPLDLIRGFVAVARRLSISQAAADLCVTQSAVSKQIRALEDYLGTPLFVRKHRSLALTEEGERFFRRMDVCFQQLVDATASVRTMSERRPVTITATIGVMSLWLLPRLGQFQQQHPAIDVRVSANNNVLDLAVEGIDLAIVPTHKGGRVTEYAYWLIRQGQLSNPAVEQFTAWILAEAEKISAELDLP